MENQIYVIMDFYFDLVFCSKVKNKVKKWWTLQ